MAHEDRIVAYSFNADIYCRECIADMFLLQTTGIPADAADAEDVLDQCAANRGINRADESTFDSGDFPKIISRSQVADEVCPRCHHPVDA